MSTAGTYNYWPKVNHPDAILPQMTSETALPRFYFGGSQIPVNLGIEHNGQTKTGYESHMDKKKEINVRGTGVVTTSKHHRIRLPRNFHI
jgi:hypothetical protein